MKNQNRIASSLRLSRNISEKRQKVLSLRREKCTAHSSLMEISLQSFRNIPEATVQEFSWPKMLSTILMGFLDKSKPCSFMAIWQLIYWRVGDLP